MYMMCVACSKDITVDSLFCNYCGAKQPEVKSALNFNSPFGLWEVTTEGDCEVRSVRNLGIHEGYLDEIAKDLSGQACYTLTFKPVALNKMPQGKKETTKTVSVVLDIDSKTWDMSPEARVKFYKVLLTGRPVKVEKGSYYATVNLRFE